jgi:hypothetical protein
MCAAILPTPTPSCARALPRSLRPVLQLHPILTFYQKDPWLISSLDFVNLGIHFIQDEFLYVLGKLVLSPRQLCGLLLRDCGTPLDPFDTNWCSHENLNGNFLFFHSGQCHFRPNHQLPMRMTKIILSN